MKSRIGFSTDKYLKAQKEAIEERLNKFSGRLYLEFGGKLLQDFHAAKSQNFAIFRGCSLNLLR
jgi:uncharacterized protein (UPF0371 family)